MAPFGVDQHPSLSGKLRHRRSCGNHGGVGVAQASELDLIEFSQDSQPQFGHQTVPQLPGPFIKPFRALRAFSPHLPQREVSRQEFGLFNLDILLARTVLKRW
jgi:hypothetical protein